MTEGRNSSHSPSFPAQTNSFEEITFAEPFANNNPDRYVSDTPEDQTVDLNGAEKISDDDDHRSANDQSHGTEFISSDASTIETVDDSDGPSVVTNIPTSDPRPEVATFRRRQAQMLPICNTPRISFGQY
jgi:hypothetical protein